MKALLDRRWHVFRNSMVVLGMLAVVAFAGCSDDDETGSGGMGSNPSSIAFTGIMINGSENGSLNVNIFSPTLAPRRVLAPDAIAATANGRFRPVGGSAVDLTGTYDVDSDSLHLSGGGYAVSAEVDSSGEQASILGTYVGPNGLGFVGALATDALPGDPLLFCGTYSSNSTSEAGNISFLVADTSFAGIAFSNMGDFFPFEGQVTGAGTTKQVSGQGGEGGVELIISGSFDTMTNQASGAWDTQDAGMNPIDNGPWDAELCP